MDRLEAFLESAVPMDFDKALGFLAEGVEYESIRILTVHGYSDLPEVVEPSFEPIHENEFCLRKASTRRASFSIARIAIASMLDGGSCPSTACSRSMTRRSRYGVTTLISRPQPRSVQR